MIKLDKEQFFTSLDWLSVVPDGQINSKDVVLSDLEKELEIYDIGHKLQKTFDNFYFVINKEDIIKFCYAFDSKLLHARITRFDVRFDFEEKFEDLFNRVRKELSFSSCITNADNKVNTVYFGSRESGLFARLYNKTLESHLDCDISRLEYEVKGSLALQFSTRWQVFDLDDAISYISKWFTEFNNTNGLISVIGLFEFHDVKPYEFFHESEFKYKMRHFVRQYRNSLIDFANYCGSIESFYDLLFDEEYLKLCKGC